MAPLGLAVDMLLEAEDTYPGTERANEWLRAFGLDEDADGALRVFVNGRPVELEGESAVADVFQACMELQRELQVLHGGGGCNPLTLPQMNVYRGQLSDSEEDLHAWFLRKHNARPYFSAYAGKSTAATPFVALAGGGAARSESLMRGLSETLHFVGECSSARPCKLSYVVLADMGSRQGLELARNALARLQSADAEASLRLALVPLGATATHARELAAEVLAQLRGGSVAGALQTLDAELRRHSHATLKLSPAGHTLLASGALAELERFARFAFGSALTQPNAVVLNGRVVPLEPAAAAAFRAHDFEALEGTELASGRAELVASVLDLDALGSNTSTAVLMACSVLGGDETQGIVRYDLAKLLSVPSMVKIGANPNALLVIDALLDPLSTAGKKFGSILLELLSSFDVEVNLMLNPVQHLEDLPLKQFYRYVALSELFFTPEGQIDNAVQNKALFPRLPAKTLFSMSLDVPDSWVVEAVAAPYDLDNLRLADVSVPRVGAMYELTHLLVEGACRDATPKQRGAASSVRGLQLQLSAAGAESFETLVMEMGGYYQLKSRPGVWQLSLTGRSSELYEVAQNKPIAVRDLSGVNVPLNVQRRHDASAEPLLPVDKDADAKLARYTASRTAAPPKAAAVQRAIRRIRWFVFC